MPSLNTPFRRLWLSSAISNLGDGIQLTSFPILAATVTSNPVEIGVVAALRGIPILAFGALAGLAADSVNRAVLMVISDAIRAVALITLLFLILSGDLQYWHIVIFSLLRKV